MEFLKQYTNQLRAMNGTTDSNGMPSQGDQELKQKEEVNEKTGIMQKITDFLNRGGFPGNKNDPRTKLAFKYFSFLKLRTKANEKERKRMTFK